MIVPSLQILFSSIVDYAGLFPPASLSLKAAIKNYTQYRNGPSAWLLGRFLLPLSRLHEFKHEIESLNLGENPSPWPVHLIIPRTFNQGVSSVSALQNLNLGEVLTHISKTPEIPTYRILAIEFPPFPPEDLREIMQHCPKNVDLFFEIPLDRHLDASLDQDLSILRRAGTFAKIRTGGVTPEMFPNTNCLGRFMVAAARTQVPFKATAGLHYLLPGEHPLTDEPEAAIAPMQGFLNLAIASTLLQQGVTSLASIIDILSQPSMISFHFESESLRIDLADRSQSYSLKLNTLFESRKRVFRGFGSCSFDLPVLGLKEASLC